MGILCKQWSLGNIAVVRSEGAPMATNVTADSLLDRVKDITPIIRAHAAEAEEKRRLSRAVVDAMTIFKSASDVESSA